MRARWIFPALAVAAGGTALALGAGLLVVPDRWNPWVSLDVREPPGWLTGFRLARLSSDDALCRRVLEQAEMRWEPLPDRVTGEGCGFRNAVRISRTSGRVAQPFAASCRLAVSLALWERHVVQPAARSTFGEAVARLEHFGSYACRNVYGRATGRRSRHATADALDVAGFVLESGRAVRDGACPLFGAVLSPDYDAAHRDHLHLERGSLGVCR